MTKGFVLWVLFFIAALLCPLFSSSSHVPYSFDNVRGRKLKVLTGNMNDYGSSDRSPASARDYRPGPIQHGTPLLPYIPKPTPPGFPPDTRCFSTKCVGIGFP